MRVRVSVEGAFKCGTKEGKGRAENKEKHVQCPEGETWRHVQGTETRSL